MPDNLYLIATPDEVAAINVARDALAAIRKRSLYDYDTQGSGMIYARAESAEASLFALLSTLRHWGEVPIADNDLYNRTVSA